MITEKVFTFLQAQDISLFKLLPHIIANRAEAGA